MVPKDIIRSLEFLPVAHVLLHDIKKQSERQTRFLT